MSRLPTPPNTEAATSGAPESPAVATAAKIIITMGANGSSRKTQGN